MHPRQASGTLASRIAQEVKVGQFPLLNGNRQS